MNPMLTCLALALAGVDLGYRPSSDGGGEFIIQINSATLQASRPGDRFDLDVPRKAQFSAVSFQRYVGRRSPSARSSHWRPFDADARRGCWFDDACLAGKRTAASRSTIGLGALAIHHRARLAIAHARSPAIDAIDLRRVADAGAITDWLPWRQAGAI